jgi:5-methylcytosine-specific restriction endonuclease McrA
MSKRQKLWAAKVRETLRIRLGWICRECGETSGLEFDCITPTGHAHHRLSTDQRATFYRRQMAVGNLQLLCADCHQAKSAHEQGPLGATASDRLPPP